MPRNVRKMFIYLFICELFIQITAYNFVHICLNTKYKGMPFIRIYFVQENFTANKKLRF